MVFAVTLNKQSFEPNAARIPYGSGAKDGEPTDAAGCNDINQGRELSSRSGYSLAEKPLPIDVLRAT